MYLFQLLVIQLSCNCCDAHLLKSPEAGKIPDVLQVIGGKGRIRIAASLLSRGEPRMLHYIVYRDAISWFRFQHLSDEVLWIIVHPSPWSFAWRHGILLVF